MKSYKVVPIPDHIAGEARKTLRSPQYKSLAANVDTATGYGPCRSCLRVFDQDVDHRIYLTYNAHDGRSKLPDPGPIFIHRDECRKFDGDGIPPGLLGLPVLFEAFGDDSSLLVRLPMERGKAHIQIEVLLADHRVRFINMRNAEAGCFIATVERTWAPSGTRL